MDETRKIDWKTLPCVADLFDDALYTITGMGKMLMDLSMASDHPGELKVAEVSIEGLDGTGRAIRNAVERMREKLDLLEAVLRGSGARDLLMGATQGAVLKAEQPVVSRPADMDIKAQTRRVIHADADPTPTPPSMRWPDVPHPVLDLAEEADDVGDDLHLIYQALKGLQSDAESNGWEFEPVLLFMQKVRDRFERISRTLAAAAHARVDQEDATGTGRERQRVKPQANPRGPGAKGIGKKIHPDPAGAAAQKSGTVPTDPKTSKVTELCRASRKVSRLKEAHNEHAEAGTTRRATPKGNGRRPASHQA